MEARSAFICILLVTAALAMSGCLQQGDEIDPTSTAPPTNASGEQTGTAPETNSSPESSDAPGNRTDEEASGAGDDAGNATGEPQAEGNQTAVEDTQASEPLDPGWPPLEEAIVRPGVPILPSQLPANDNGRCTSNFVLEGPMNRTLYLGVAGHCVDHLSLGDPVAIADGSVEGHLAWFEDNDTQDFGLLEIPDDARPVVHPKLLHWGGPTGLAEDPSVGDHLLFYGNSENRAGVERIEPTEGYVTGRNESAIHSVVPVVNGDSGGPAILDDGGAMGTVRGYHGSAGLSLEGTFSQNGVAFSPLPEAIEAAEKGLGIELELATWPQERTGQLPTFPLAS